MMKVKYLVLKHIGINSGLKYPQCEKRDHFCRENRFLIKGNREYFSVKRKRKIQN